MMSSEDLLSRDRIRNEFFGLLDLKAPVLMFYSPYSFLRNVSDADLSRETFIDPLKREVIEGKTSVVEIDVDGYKTYIAWKALPWDSQYFNRRVFRIELILSEHSTADNYSRAVNRFLDEVAMRSDYISVNIPCEDLSLIQGLSGTGFRLVETRLNYYFTGFNDAGPPGAPVRRATGDDIAPLRDVAMQMRNRFDRVHADPAFAADEADAYLGTFIEESVKGFADLVMVPDVSGKKPFGFLAADNPVDILGFRIAKLVLAAVDGRDNKGWLYHLLAGVIHELKSKNTDILTTITQAANRPAIRTWEKAGFKLGFVTHVFSYSKQ